MRQIKKQESLETEREGFIMTREQENKTRGDVKKNTLTPPLPREGDCC